jgi:hypothetical protein
VLCCIRCCRCRLHLRIWNIKRPVGQLILWICSFRSFGWSVVPITSTSEGEGGRKEGRKEGRKDGRNQPLLPLSILSVKSGDCSKALPPTAEPESARTHCRLASSAASCLHRLRDHHRRIIRPCANQPIGGGGQFVDAGIDQQSRSKHAERIRVVILVVSMAWMLQSR